MAYILHIETSTKMCSVALSLDGASVGHQNFQDDNGYAHSEKLTLLIEALFEQVGINRNQLQAISVSGGPGSYTGLRIGVSTAKGLCYALGIPLIAIDSLDCLNRWTQQNNPHHTGYFLSMIDARRMEVYSLIQDHKMAVIKPISADILEVDSYRSLLENQPVLISGDGAEKSKACWLTYSTIHYSALLADARGQIEVAFARYLAQQFEDVAYYEPYYLKDFIAGTKKG
jgi:tRNA threonylcarbamoyladenosine biosynthesis protein TsaB